MISRKSEDKRVVITGLGVISSIGLGCQEFWKNLIAGKSGISEIQYFDTSDYECHKAGEIHNFEPSQFMDKRKAKLIGRASQFAIAATKLAFEDAKLNPDDLLGFNVGVSLGTTMGEPQVKEQFDQKTIPKGKDINYDVQSSLAYPSNAIANNVTSFFNLSGRSTVFATACAAGNYAIGRSYDLIKSGKQDLMIAGGADALSRIAFTGFNRLFAMAKDKCQPYDLKREGMMVGEGAGVLILESLEHAKKRGASVYAEILGYGVSCDAKHMTNPSVDGVSKAIKRSLNDAVLTTDKIDYISTHGTGTKENDRAECSALLNIFNGTSSNLAVSSIKSMLGHSMGAASALEAISCCLAIKYNEIPPTINYTTPDPECDVNCVPNKSAKKEINTVLNLSQAFGGNNACVALKSIKI